MLSYRHAFHAGNHADVLKHFILWLTLDYFNRKDKPYWYIDTHSGAGLYDLRSPELQKILEYQNGISRLQQSSTLPELLQLFVQYIHSIIPQTHLYCGSPWLAQATLRENDKLRLFELHPTDFQHLQNNMREARLNRRGVLKQEDGFHGLISLLPPPTRRAVVLIDPSYENKSDYENVIKTLKEAQKRFKQGCYLIWYPCLSRIESQKLPKQLKNLSPYNYLQAELYVQHARTDGFGMHGSGMWLINPPYLLVEQLRHTLPILVERLQQDDGARYILNYQLK